MINLSKEKLNIIRSLSRKTYEGYMEKMMIFTFYFIDKKIKIDDIEINTNNDFMKNINCYTKEEIEKYVNKILSESICALNNNFIQKDNFEIDYKIDLICIKKVKNEENKFVYKYKVIRINKDQYIDKIKENIKKFNEIISGNSQEKLKYIANSDEFYKDNKIISKEEMYEPDFVFIRVKNNITDSSIWTLIGSGKCLNMEIKEVCDEFGINPISLTSRTTEIKI